MNINRYSYLRIIFGWGLGQVINFLISNVIYGSLISGRFFGVIVIFISRVPYLIVTCIGGLCGGAVCGFFLYKGIKSYYPKKSKHIYLLIILGWALAFMIGNGIYRLGEILNVFSDLFQLLYMSIIAIASILITGIIGGVITMAMLDMSTSRRVIGTFGWCLGLLLGFGIKEIVGEILFGRFPYSLDFDVQTTLMNVIGGFLYGAIAGWLGSWVMFKIMEREHKLVS
jgi:hypothetical protein